MDSWIWYFTETRPIEDGEIAPVSAEQSRTVERGAELAIDLDMETYSSAHRDGNNGVWLKVTLGQVKCINQVKRYKAGENTGAQTWTCSSEDCTTCGGGKCSDFSLEVFTEGPPSDNLPQRSDCKYGDTVKLEYVAENSRDKFFVAEIIIIGNQGELPRWDEPF